MGDIASTLGATVGRPARARGDRFDQLLTACRRLGAYLDVEFVDPPASYRLGTDHVAAIAMAAGVRHRRVALERGWERRGSRPVLAFRAGAETPVAVLPRPGGGFVAYDPVDETETPVDDALLGALGPLAFEFYAPLPDRPLGLRDLLAIGFRHQGRTLAVLAVAGVVGGLLALVLPIATQWVFNQFIPDDDRQAI